MKTRKLPLSFKGLVVSLTFFFTAFESHALIPPSQEYESACLALQRMMGGPTSIQWYNRVTRHPVITIPIGEDGEISVFSLPCSPTHCDNPACIETLN
jgi:hypothetical protein